MFDGLQAGEVEGVMLDRYKAYYYLDQLKNDNFRVALLLDVPQEYGVALVDRGFPEFTAKNGCLAKYFANSHRLDRTMKHYISPVKVCHSYTHIKAGYELTPSVWSWSGIEDCEKKFFDRSISCLA